MNRSPTDSYGCRGAFEDAAIQQVQKALNSLSLSDLLGIFFKFLYYYQSNCPCSTKNPVFFFLPIVLVRHKLNSYCCVLFKNRRERERERKRERERERERE